MNGHIERIVHVAASPAEVFARLDEQIREHAATANAVDERVTERAYPRRKAWRTRGTTNLFFIDAYTMGCEVAAEDDGTSLRVWIDYRLPCTGMARMLAPLPAAVYARWRVDDLAQDAADSFTDMPTVIAAHP